MLEPTEDLIYSTPEGYELAQSATLIDKSRWSVVYRKVLQQKDTNKFYAVFWTEGSTEYQDHDIEVWIEEVVPFETIDYKKKQSVIGKKI